MAAEVKLAFDRSEAFICEAMIKLGLPGADAATFAGWMVEADLQGSDGHSFNRRPQDARRIRAGGFNTRPDIHVVREHA